MSSGFAGVSGGNPTRASSENIKRQESHTCRFLVRLVERWTCAGDWDADAAAARLDAAGHGECGGAVGKFVSAEGCYSCVVPSCVTGELRELTTLEYFLTRPKKAKTLSLIFLEKICNLPQYIQLKSNCDLNP